MIALFTHAPEVATPTLLEIVRHATAVWAAHASRARRMRRRSRSCSTVSGCALTGDAGVMHWHRGGPMVPSALVSALMGLEQYLYRRLDRQIRVRGRAELLASAAFAVAGDPRCPSRGRLRFRPQPRRPLRPASHQRRPGRSPTADLQGRRARLPGCELLRARASQPAALARSPPSLGDAEAGRHGTGIGGRGPGRPIGGGTSALGERADGRWPSRGPAGLRPTTAGRTRRRETDWVFCPPEELRRVLDAARDEDELRRWWLETPGELKKAIEEGRARHRRGGGGVLERAAGGARRGPVGRATRDSALRRAAVECGVAVDPARLRPGLGVLAAGGGGVLPRGGAPALCQATAHDPVRLPGGGR